MMSIMHDKTTVELVGWHVFNGEKRPNRYHVNHEGKRYEVRAGKTYVWVSATPRKCGFWRGASLRLQQLIGGIVVDAVANKTVKGWEQCVRTL